MKGPNLDVTKTVFDNGLTLLILERHHIPIVTSTIWYKVGSANESQGQTGISHFLEHLMFKGTPTYAKGAIDFLTSIHGGNNNAGTIYDYTMYYFNFSSDRWEIALEIEADRMRNCLFDPREFEAERRVILEELKQQQDSPWGKLGMQVEAAMFPNHPYAHSPIGLQKDIEQVTRAAVIAYYQEYYVPNNAVLVIVGDIQPQRVIQKVAQCFARLPKGQDLPVNNHRNHKQPGAQRIEMLQDTTLKRLNIGYPAATLRETEHATLDVIDYLLSHGKTSRLYQRLVEHDQSVTFVDVYNHPRRLAGVFSIFAELRPGISPEGVEQALHEEILRLHTEPIAPEELQKVNNAIAADFLFEQETTTGLAHALGEYEILSTYKDLHRYLDTIRQVTPKQIMHVAQTYLAEEHRTVGWSLPQNHEQKDTFALELSSPADPPATEMVFYKPYQQTFPTHRWVLENGLTVVFLEQHQLPVVAIEAFVDAGQKYVPDEKAGLAVLTGRLLEEGTQTRTALEIAQALEFVGGTLHINSRGASAQVLSKDFPLALEIGADILMHPVFPPESIEKERSRLLGSLEGDEDNPALVAYNLFHEMVYGPHPYHYPKKGYKETVQKLTQADIVAYYSAYFAPNNTMLAIVGDIAPAEVWACVQRCFGSWGRRDLPPQSMFEIPQPEGCLTKSISKEKEQNHVYLGHLGITRTNPDYYALLVMDHILGTGPGFTDRISRKLRDEQGLAYSVYAAITLSADVEPGTFMAYIGTSPDNTDLAMEGFREEITRIRTEPVSPEELDLAKNYLTGSYVFYFETSTQLARYLINIERFQLGDDFLWRYPQLIQAVTVEDVQRVAQHYLDPDNYYIALVGRPPD